MEGNLKQKLLEHSVFLVQNINPTTLLWARLRAAFVIDEDEEERCKVSKDWGIGHLLHVLSHLHMFMFLANAML